MRNETETPQITTELDGTLTPVNPENPPLNQPQGTLRKENPFSNKKTFESYQHKIEKRSSKLKIRELFNKLIKGVPRNRYDTHFFKWDFNTQSYNFEAFQASNLNKTYRREDVSTVSSIFY
jgi:hypothetical protein